MTTKSIYNYIGIACMSFISSACSLPSLSRKAENRAMPSAYSFTSTQDSTNTAKLNWRDYFADPYLVALIDTALKNNQELNITLQEIEISRNEIRARKGEYLPFVGIKAGAGFDKPGRYTNTGTLEANTEIVPGKERSEPLPDYMIAATATWEVDIWRKLRNAKKAAVSRYLSSIEGKNFIITILIADIANSYYELLALDNQLDIVRKNIEIQTNALKIVKLQKESARVTELAVRKFEAQVLNTQSLQYDIQQQITETENKINFLLGRYPQPIQRDDSSFNMAIPQTIYAGIPSQLLINRPDVRQAEQELAAAKLDVKVARAKFYPSLGISASLGYNAFNPSFLLKSPESLLYSLAGELAAPLVNRNSVKAEYNSANARQIQAIYDYERTLLNAYIEVVNQLAKIHNLSSSYDLKLRQVQALTQSINISNDLFKSARADYMEVLMTQRDGLEGRFELIETRKEQMIALVNIYQALGGGWN